MVTVTCKWRGVALCAALSGIILGAAAEVIQSLPRPVRGMSTDSVLEQFGLPESQSEPIGNPPIPIWRYPSHSVYFESATVIHSVLTHRPQVPVEPE
ncbi:MAG: phosphodiesterase [Gammaproteobacteria bacterium]